MTELQQQMRKTIKLNSGTRPRTPGIYRFRARIFGSTMDTLEPKTKLAGMRPERPSGAGMARGGFKVEAVANSDLNPSNISLLKTKNGLDNGVYFILHAKTLSDPFVKVAVQEVSDVFED